MLYKQWDVVLINFPLHSNRQEEIVKRPAVILSNSDFEKKTSHVILGMITSSDERKWEIDVEIKDLKKAGLKPKDAEDPKPYFRPKIFTADSRVVSGKIGSICQKDRKSIKKLLKEIL